jgi:hypothetical protein
LLWTTSSRLTTPLQTSTLQSAKSNRRPSPTDQHSTNLPRKMKVTSQTSELEALEARLRATEERLKAAASGETSPTSRRSGGSSPRTRAPLGDTFSHAQREREQPTSPLSESTRAPSRPQTANRPKTRDGRPVTGRRPTESHSQAPPMPGALPPTPGASEGESESLSESEPEYVLVERQRMNPSADLNPVAEDDGDDVPPPPPAKDNQ